MLCLPPALFLFIDPFSLSVDSNYDSDCSSCFNHSFSLYQFMYMYSFILFPSISSPLFLSFSVYSILNTYFSSLSLVVHSYFVCLSLFNFLLFFVFFLLSLSLFLSLSLSFFLYPSPNEGSLSFSRIVFASLSVRNLDQS